MISAIKLDDGTIVSSPAELCASFAAFYSSLFSATPTDPVVRDSLLRNVSSSSSPAIAALCEGHLSVAECLAALQGMARRKAPGLDSLPMEFYVKFWPVLGSDLVHVLNSCFDSVFPCPSDVGSFLCLLRRVIVWTLRTGGRSPFLT